MSDFTSGKRNGREIREENLRPIQPGQVLNPEGRNQWTYRREWEQEIDKALRAKSDDERRTVLQELAESLLSGARAGKPWAMQLIMKRVWPERSKLEVEDTTPGLESGCVWKKASARLDEMEKRGEIEMGELPPEMQELHQKLGNWLYSPTDREARVNETLDVAKILLEVQGWQLIPPEGDASEA